MLKIAVCDDDSGERAHVTALLKQYQAQNHLAARIDAFSSAVELMEALHGVNYDLLLLDILDHIIVAGGTGDVYSFRRNNSYMFDSENIDLKFIHKMFEKEDQRLTRVSEDSVTVVYPRQRHR